jgi:hypothetical protein
MVVEIAQQGDDYEQGPLNAREISVFRARTGLRGFSDVGYGVLIPGRGHGGRRVVAPGRGRFHGAGG